MAKNKRLKQTNIQNVLDLKVYYHSKVENMLKFIYSEKAAKFYEISTLLLSVHMYCRQK